MEKISFVVQGPIVKGPASESSPFDTSEVLLSIRRHYPQAEIVLSTWKGADVANLEYDVLVLSDDPGGIPNNGSLINCNRMVVSSRAGIRKASHSYVVKTRTDIAFVNSSIHDRLKEIKPIKNKYGVFGHFVLSSVYYVRDPTKLNLVFHPSDIFLIGKKDDLLNFFDVPMTEKACFINPNGDTKVVPEQYLFIQHIFKMTGQYFNIPAWGYVNLRYFMKSERFLFNNFLFFETEALGFRLSDRLYHVFMPECNYTLEDAKRLSKVYRSAAGLTTLQTMRRGLKYLDTYHIPYLKSTGWKTILKKSLTKLSTFTAHGN